MRDQLRTIVIARGLMVFLISSGSIRVAHSAPAEPHTSIGAGSVLHSARPLENTPALAASKTNNPASEPIGPVLLVHLQAALT